MILLILIFIGRVHEVIPGVGSLPLGNVVAALAVASLLFGGYGSRLGQVLGTPQTRLALLLLILGLVTVPFALWPGGAVTAIINAAKLWILCIIIPLSVCTTRQLSLITRTFVIAAALLVLGHVLEGLVGIEGFTTRQSVGFDRNDVALFAVMGIPFALAWAPGGRKSRLVGFGLAGFLVAGIVATGSRGGFLSMAAVGLVFLVRSKILSTAKKVAIVVGALAVLTFAGSGDYWDRVGSIFSSPTEDYNFQSREGRIEIWKRGLGYAADHPLTGVGFGNFPVAEGQLLRDLGYGVKWSTAHNAYILALAELGIPGLILFLAVLLSIAREAGRASGPIPRGRGPPDPATREAEELSSLADATKLALLGYAVSGIFLSATYSVSFVFLVALGASLHLMRRRVVAMARVIRAPGVRR